MCFEEKEIEETEGVKEQEEKEHVCNCHGCKPSSEKLLAAMIFEYYNQKPILNEAEERIVDLAEKILLT